MTQVDSESSRSGHGDGALGGCECGAQSGPLVANSTSCSSAAAASASLAELAAGDAGLAVCDFSTHIVSDPVQSLRGARSGHGSARRWAMTLGCLALLAVTVASVTFSGASFLSNRTTNVGNTLSAGTLTFTNDHAGQAVLDVHDLAPGGSASGVLTLTNNGDFAANAVLRNAGIVDEPNTPALSDALLLTVADISVVPAQQLYSGTLSALNTVSLGSFAVGESRTLRFTVSFPVGDAVAALQGAKTSVTLSSRGSRNDARRDGNGQEANRRSRNWSRRACLGA